MRRPKTLLSFDVNVYTAQSRLPFVAAQQKRQLFIAAHCGRVGGKRLSVEIYV
jgi:hypothetical protein